MKKLLVAAICAVVASSANAAPARAPELAKRVVPGRLLVRPADKAAATDPSSSRAFVARLGRALGEPLELVRSLPLGWLYVDATAVVDEQATELLAKRAAGLPLVGAASSDQIMRQMRVPNDPLLEFMWHVDRMNLPAAWDVATGGGNTVVAIIDSGIVAHEDLDASLVGGLDFISDPSVSLDGDGRDGNPFDDAFVDTHLHGTHVAGSIGARGNNGVGVVGGIWSARLMPVRALGAGGSGLTSDIGEAVFWAGGGNVDGIVSLEPGERAQVINMSLGGAAGDPCNPFYQEIFEAIDAVLVVATGNDGGAVSSPANCSNVIAVAASGPTNDLTSYSNFGPEVSIVAPGGDMSLQTADGILSTTHEQFSSFTDAAPYGFLEGTSMATPNVAGVVALMLDVDNTLTSNQIRSILQQTGTSCGGCGGKRLIDAGAALAVVNAGGGGGGGCDNSCEFANDGECDDGSPGAATSVCAPSTDCNDCAGDEGGGGSGGVIGGGGGGGGNNDDDNIDSLPVCTEDTNSCRYAFDGECDEDSVCDEGTDAADCGACSDDGSVEPPPLCGSHAGVPLTSLGVLLALLRRRRSAR